MPVVFKCFIDGVDRGPAGTGIVESITASSSGKNRIGRATVTLNFPAAAGYTFVNKREVQIYETGTTINSIFGGFITRTRRKRMKGNTEKWVTLDCEDYNKLLDSIRTGAGTGAAFTVAAGTMAAQIASVVETMQKNGHASVFSTIDTTLYVQNLTGAHVLPAFEVKGMTLRDALQTICNNAQTDTPTLRPRFTLQLMDDGASSAIVALVVWDGAAPVASVMTLSITPTGAEQGIMDVEVVDDSSQPLSNKREIIYQSQNGLTLVYAFVDPTSAATYYTNYQSDNLNGVEQGYWKDEVVQADSTVTSGAAAQDRINIVGAQNTYPRETIMIKWQRPAGSTIFVKPGNTIHVTLDDIDADYEVSQVTVDFPIRNDPSVEFVTITAGVPMLKLFENGEDGVSGPAHEIDFVPPNPPGAPSVTSNVINPATGQAELTLGYSASTSPDVAGYMIVGAAGGIVIWQDVGTSLTPTFTLPPGVAFSLQNLAYDGARPPNISAAGGTVSGTTSAPVYDTLVNPDAESADRFDNTLPYHWTRTVANGGTAERTTSTSFTGVASFQLITTGSLGSTAKLTSILTVVRGATYGLAFWAKASGSTNLKINYNWYDSAQAFVSTTTITRAVTTGWGRYTGAATVPATAAYYRMDLFLDVISKTVDVDTITSEPQLPNDGLEVITDVTKVALWTSFAGPRQILDSTGVLRGEEGASTSVVRYRGINTGGAAPVSIDVESSTADRLHLDATGGGTSLVSTSALSLLAAAGSTAILSADGAASTILLGVGGSIGLTGTTSVLSGGLIANAYFNLAGVSTKNGTFTADAAAAIYLCDSAGAISANLPTASGITGRRYTFNNINTGLVTIDGSGSQTIGGLLTYPLPEKCRITIFSDGANWQIESADGLFSASNVYKNTNQTAIPVTSFTKVTWTTEVYDLAAEFASDKFTCTIPGIYQVLATILVDGGASVVNDQYMARIYKNGATIGEGRMFCQGTGNYTLIPILIPHITLAATDTLEIYFWHNNGGGTNRDIYGSGNAETAFGVNKVS